MYTGNKICTFLGPTQTAITAQCERHPQKYYCLSVVQPSQHFGVIAGERAEKHYASQQVMALYTFKVILDQNNAGVRRRLLCQCCSRRGIGGHLVELRKLENGFNILLTVKRTCGKHSNLLICGALEKEKKGGGTFGFIFL